MAQHEMVLSEESEFGRVVNYLGQLKESVERLKAETQRINKYQALFKVGRMLLLLYKSVANLQLVRKGLCSHAEAGGVLVLMCGFMHTMLRDVLSVHTHVSDLTAGTLKVICTQSRCWC